MTPPSSEGATPHLIALEQPGLELQAPHVRPRTKRRIESADVDVSTLASDSLRFIGWAPQTIEASFPSLDPAASYEIEAVYLCERDVVRVQRMTSRGGIELHPPVNLTAGTSTVVRIAVPQAAVADRRIDVSVERI